MKKSSDGDRKMEVFVSLFQLIELIAQKVLIFLNLFLFEIDSASKLGIELCLESIHVGSNVSHLSLECSDVLLNFLRRCE